MIIIRLLVSSIGKLCSRLSRVDGNKSFCFHITFDGIQNKIKHENRSILK